MRKGITIFRQKCCLTIPKNFVEEPFCAVFQKNSGSEKVFVQEGGGEHQNFPSKIFCLSAKILRRESFTVALISGTEKVWIRGGGGREEASRYSVEIFLFHSPEKVRR